MCLMDYSSEVRRTRIDEGIYIFIVQYFKNTFAITAFMHIQ